HNRTTAIVSIVRITLVALLVVVGTLTVSILTCKKKSKLVQTVYEVPPPQACRNCVAEKSPVEKLFLQAESEGRTTARITVVTVMNSWLTDRTSRLSSHSSGGQAVTIESVGEQSGRKRKMKFEAMEPE
ncbi:hypothetical protein ATANTOWER_021736, partial [Ataeniobius toweri]|nr:hypothetical protein [Ataeniobius toweri]